MGVLPLLKGRFAPVVRRNALFKNANFVIMLKAYIISRFSVIIIDNFDSSNGKVYPELDRTTS